MSVPFAACIVLAEFNTKASIADSPLGAFCLELLQGYTVWILFEHLLSHRRGNILKEEVKENRRQQLSSGSVSDQPLLMMIKSLNVCVAQF